MSSLMSETPSREHSEEYLPVASGWLVEDSFADRAEEWSVVVELSF